MGELQYAMEQALFEELEECLTRESVWRCANGTRVRVCDMTDSHLLNTIRVLRGMSPLGTKVTSSAETRREWLNTMANEAYARQLQIDPLTEDELADAEHE